MFGFGGVEKHLGEVLLLPPTASRFKAEKPGALGFHFRYRK